MTDPLADVVDDLEARDPTVRRLALSDLRDRIEFGDWTARVLNDAIELLADRVLDPADDGTPSLALRCLDVIMMHQRTHLPRLVVEPLTAAWQRLPDGRLRDALAERLKAIGPPRPAPPYPSAPDPSYTPTPIPRPIFPDAVIDRLLVETRAGILTWTQAADGAVIYSAQRSPVDTFKLTQTPRGEIALVIREGPLIETVTQRKRLLRAAPPLFELWRLVAGG